MSIRVKQRDASDCGAACIASIAASYHLFLPVSLVRQFASTDKQGTTIQGIIQAFTKFGFDAKGVRGGKESLSLIPKPSIAHVTVSGGHHYVVIHSVTNSRVVIMDPGSGTIRRIAIDQFVSIWTGILVIAVPGPAFQPGDQKVSIAGKLRKLLLGHKTIMFQVLFSSMVYTILGLSTSIYVQKIVDYVIPDKNHNLLNLMSVAMIVLLIIQQWIGSSKGILTLRTGQALDAQLILGYYKHLLTLPQQFFDTMRVGEIISRVNDAVKIRTFINEALSNLAVNVFIILFSFGLMFTYYWKLAFLSLLIIPFYAIVYWITQHLNISVERKLMENAANLESQLVESLSGILTIKAFGLEEQTNKTTEFQFVQLLKSIRASGLNTIFSGTATEFFSRLMTVILLWAGSRFVLENELTPGELFSFYALIAYFTGPAGSLIGLNKTINNAIIAADRLFEIMDVAQEKSVQCCELTPKWEGSISFQDVRFHYGSRLPILNGLSFDIPKGKITAIAGKSGSGKSTIAYLLHRMYDIDSGSIVIGEHNLNYLSRESLRKVIGIVPQKVELLSGNVIENVAVGDYEPDFNRILALTAQLGIREFIEKLPHGFFTPLGESGVMASGGQRQRIAIARALYRHPDILVLDEATSSLDSEAERFVTNLINDLRKQGVTIVLITHKLQSVVHADKIIVIADGKVAEEGNHDELLKNKGAYWELWESR